MAYKLKKNLANRKNYGNKRSTKDIKYIIIHFTANDGDTDENNGKYFANNVKYASAHYFVDDDSVTQSVPDNYVAYSVGGNKYNNNGGRLYGKATNQNTLNIELCDDRKNGKIYPSKQTIENAIAFTKKLRKKYNIPQENVIRHYDVNGKPCPAYWCGTSAKDKKWKTEFWDKLVDEPKFYAKFDESLLGVDAYLKAIGVPAKYRGEVEKRVPLAEKNGIKNYTGTKAQNKKLINKAKKGKLKKV